MPSYRPCTANISAGTKLGAASHPQILSLEVVLFKGGRSVRSPIDAFILERLQKEGIQPAKEATRETWLRRASFDLTGLPPTLEDLDRFLADQSPNAYERAADRLLGSQAFGERMTNEWLDVARYADTFGYQSDRDTHLWPWRDWVIRAFNSNLPYDQFIIWQTAGDLLPEAMACLGNPDPVGMKVYCPTGKETFDDETTEEAPPRRDRGEAA